jgi:subtilisin family serine protease
MRAAAFACVLASLLAYSSTAGAAADTTVAPRQLIVGFSGEVSRGESRAIVKGTDASVATRLAGGSLLVDVDPGASVAAVARELRGADGVRYASPNHIVHASAVQPDPLLASGAFWGLSRLHAEEAWSASSGRGALVAVLDGGVNLANPDIAPNLWVNASELPGNGIDDDNNGFADDVTGADWVDRDGSPGDAGGHGTHVAGTIAAAVGNGFGGAGIAPGARIMPLRFLDAHGSGTIADAISAIDYAIENGADVINASWGGPDYSPPLRDAFARAGAAGIVVVAAAGNDGVSNAASPTYPAAFNLPNLIAVAASNQRDALAAFSNYGGGVAVAAPGVGIFSTEGTGIAAMSGTSMAAPHVAGIAALLSSFNGQLSPAAVIAAIASGARKNPALAGKVTSGGVADAVGALNAVGADVAAVSRGEAPGAFKLKKPGRRVRIHGRSGWVRFAWSRAEDSDLIGYDVIVNGKVRKHVRSTNARVRVPAGRFAWSVVAIDAEGNQTTALRTARSNGRLSVLRVKRR